MAVERRFLSVSQLAELLEIDPYRLIDVEVNRATSTVTLVLEPEKIPASRYAPTDMGYAPEADATGEP